MNLPAVKLGEGSYDAIVLSPTGAVLRGRRFVVDRRTKRISLAPDERPTLTVLLPEGESSEGWTAMASRRVPPLGSVGAAAWTTGAGSDGEPAATIEPEPPRTLKVILPAPGRYVLTLTPSGVGFSLLRTVLVAPKATERLEVPTIEITVRGSASGFPRNFEGAHHGVAGPRLLLVSAPEAQGGSGWDVLVGLPKSTGRSAAFRFGPIPRGHYFLHQHLTELDAGAWGGLAVHVSPDQTDLPDWSTVAPRDLEIQVSDSKGEPITNGMLSLHDPMAESWREFMRLPTTATFADHPIPSPPSASLEGRPVTFPRIRPGHVELEVETSEGRRFRFHRIIHDDKPLQLQLPPG